MPTTRFFNSYERISLTKTRKKSFFLNLSLIRSIIRSYVFVILNMLRLNYFKLEKCTSFFNLSEILLFFKKTQPHTFFVFSEFYFSHFLVLFILLLALSSTYALNKSIKSNISLSIFAMDIVASKAFSCASRINDMPLSC